MAYVYKPNSVSTKRIKRTVSKKPVTGIEKKYINTIVKANLLSLAIIISSIFAFLLIFSNINNLWGVFKTSEKYVEEDNNKPAKPFLETDSDYTKESNISLKGAANQGQKITLFKDNNVESETIADAENKFYFDNVAIKNENGSNVAFYVIAKNEKGEESEKSNEVIVTFDNEKPKLTVSSPSNDDRVKSYSRSLEVTGTTEVGAKVTVNGTFARINQNNEYSATIKLDDEVNTIKVEAEDKAGNKSFQEIGVYFEKIS